MAFVGIARPPHLAQQLAVRQYFAGVLHQRGQQFELDRGEVHLCAGHEHLAQREIDVQVADLKDRAVCGAGRPAGMAQGHTQARQQFGDAKRLREIVVGAGIQGQNLIPFLLPPIKR